MQSQIMQEIKMPEELRSMGPDELSALAEVIRAHIIDAVEQHGGHLGSNLGAVELTIALHRVFRSPHDILLWDTGHQAYAHKILTGRAEDFASLRQQGGLSGYPCRTESAHDWIENSHASTSLAYAHGLSLAMEAMQTTDRKVVAIIGDGALTGGMAFEGLNNLGNAGSDCIIVLNDNGRSYAPTASRLSASLLGVRSDRDAQGHDHLDLTGATNDPPRFFEALGLHYAGPVDGHDFQALEDALTDAASRRGPQVVHVLTQKGRGHLPAESDPIKRMHDTSVAKPDSYTVAFGQSLVELAAEEPRVVAITAAMPDSTGLLSFADHFPDRFVDVGIAEQHAVTAAAGMAMGGLVPFVAVYATFLTRAIDQVIYDVGLHGLPVVFCLDRAGITGDDGASHHGLLDMVLLSKVPGITMFAPSSLAELPVMLRDALAIATGPDPGPVAIRWSKTIPVASIGHGAGHGLAARKVREGDDVCLIGIGKGLEAALGAADMLAVQGIHATVWDPRCIRPIDEALLRDASSHRLVVTIEDGLCEGGIGASIAEHLHAGRAPYSREPRVVVLGTPCAYLPHASPAQLTASLGLDAQGVADVVSANVPRKILQIVGASA